MNDSVVILHGIFRTHRSMEGLARYLHRNGFRVHNLGYPSTKYPIEGLADLLRPKVATIEGETPGSVHFVGFSMGGLVIRSYLSRYRPRNLGRVVMIGTPNNGSEVADFVKEMRWYRWLYGAAGQQLVTERSALAAHFGPIDYPLGVIAGNRSIDPVSSWIIGKPNDGKVSIESTKIDGMTDHIVIPSSHTFFPSNRLTWSRTLTFLREGHF